MDTCFLFAQYLDEKGCLSLKLSLSGMLLAPLEYREFKQIRELQENCRTYIVVPTIQASILELNLPWLSESKARLALPYALEEKLAQPVEELHFAFDKERYHNNQYLVTVLSKEKLAQLMSDLDQQSIDFDLITLDWFALNHGEMALCGSTLLVHDNEFMGAISGDLALKFIDNHPLNILHIFSDSDLTKIRNTMDHSETNNTLKHEECSEIWIAQSLIRRKPLNLCQGALRHEKKSDWIQKGYQLAGLLCIAWLVSILLVNGILMYSLNKKIAQLDEQIAVIYHEFFPEAKQVISPKFRISKLIGSEMDNGQSKFWFLLNQFAKGMKEEHIQLEQLRYQNNTLFIHLICDDFDSLEHFENQLKQLNIHVKQTQASSKNQKVLASLELS